MPRNTEDFANGGGLSDIDKLMLQTEEEYPNPSGEKYSVIRDRFDMSPTRYHMHLNHLIDNDAAHAHNPMVVGRLRRAREAVRVERRARDARLTEILKRR